MKWFIAVIFLILAGVVAYPAFAASAELCMSAREAREIVAQRHVLPPFEVMNSMSTLARAEPLNIRLCRSGESLTYEVDLLHHDGRLLRIYVDAFSGKTVNPK